VALSILYLDDPEPTDGVGPVVAASVTDGTLRTDGVLPGEKIVRMSAVYTKGIQRDPTDGGEIEIYEDLLPAEHGQDSAERLIVQPATSASASDPLRRLRAGYPWPARGATEPTC